MNEKIKELAKQAELPCRDRSIGELDADGNIITTKAWDTVDPRVLKFVELLLKDAARFVDSQISDNGYGVADSWCQGKDLLEHFGVE